MKVTIYNAISIDGYIATQDQQTDWVSETDWKQFNDLVKKSEVIVMGRNTYQTSDIFPYDCELNIVMTSQKDLLNSNKHTNTIFTNKTPKQVVKLVEKLGYKQLLIIGGGKLNASFIKEGLVDEVIVDIHPIILGSGVKLFEAENLNVKLKKIDTTELKEGLVTIKYKIK